MKENHILLEGNDPFFTFGQFKTLMCTGNIPSWETIEIGIKNWMSGEVTFDQCDSKCVVVKSELKRFYRNVNRTRNAQTQKGAVSRGLDMKQNHIQSAGNGPFCAFGQSRCAKSVLVKIFKIYLIV